MTDPLSRGDAITCFRQNRQIEQKARAIWMTGYDRQIAMKLPRHAGDHLEAQARTGLIDSESLRKPDALV